MRALVLFLILCALGGGAYALELLPATGRVQQLRDLALRLSEASGMIQRTQPEPGLALASEHTWVRGGYAFGKLRVRNEGNVAIEASAGTVHCTAVDTQHRVLGSWKAGDLGSLKPGQEIALGIGIPLRKGRLASLDCHLVE